MPPWPSSGQCRPNVGLGAARCGYGWGLHRGRPTLTETGYVGLSVHAAARICFAGHGG